MTEQMTRTGVLMLCGGIAVFWFAIALTIRVHRHRHMRIDVEASR